MEQKKSQLKTGIVLNYVNIILGNLIPVFYTPIMLSLLGQKEYGLYKLSSSVTSYLSLISLGIGSAVVRYLIKAREEEGKEAEEQVLGLFMVIFQMIAAVALLIGTILAFNLDLFYGKSLSAVELSQMKVLVLIMVCNTALSFSQAPYTSVVSAHEKFVFLQCANILTTCVGPIANLIALFLGYASIGMAVSSLLICLICRIAYYAYVKKHMHLRARYHNLPTNLIKEILTFSFWIFIANVATQLYNATDTVMIGMVPSLATIGVSVYNIGGTFNNIVSSLTTGISSLLTPKANRMVFQKATNSELTDLTVRVGRIQALIMALVVTGFIAFGKPFIFFYAGEGYSDSYWVAVLVMLPNMIPLVQSMCLSILVAQNKHCFRSIVYLGMAILNAIGTWILMQYMGVIGAALMSGIALIIGNGFIMNWYYQNRTGLDMIRFWKEIGKMLVVPTVMCIFTLALSKYIDFYRISTLALGIVIYSLIYCTINWLFIMNDYEKKLIKGPVQLVISKFKRR
ncbi:MAG: oligosaccharide flippase family protein [Clostridiales bacterium]|nr:oligosaccharide flippase family protein [Clostridiales bacterium]